MKKIVMSAVAVVLTLFGLCGVVGAVPVYADTTTTTPTPKYCPGYSATSNPTKTYIHSVAECGLDQANDGHETELMTSAKDVINVILGVVGLVAVVVIILGGISFMTSQGDTGKVTKARNTILYGVIGLIVALLAFAIVNFVLTGVFG